MRMKRLLLMFCLGLTMTGCASLHHTGYLDNYDQLRSVSSFGQIGWNPNTQQKAYVDPAYTYSSSQTLMIKKPQVAKGIKLDDYEKQMYADFLYNHLNDMISEKGIYQVTQEPTADLVLDSYIGVLDPGNGFMRWFFGMGLGKADFQMESKIIDTATGKTVVSYAYRAQDPGHAWFGLNLSELDNQTQVDNAMKDIAKSYSKFLEKEFKK